MKIGELARRASVTTKTIRHYENIGMLPPPPRAPNGYRDYSDDTLEQLRFIQSAEHAGLRLGEIREILALRDRGECPCPQVVERMEHVSDELPDMIAGLRKLTNVLRALTPARGDRLDARPR